jgi:hypothetical protein
MGPAPVTHREAIALRLSFSRSRLSGKSRGCTLPEVHPSECGVALCLRRRTATISPLVRTGESLRVCPKRCVPPSLCGLAGRHLPAGPPVWSKSLKTLDLQARMSDNQSVTTQLNSLDTRICGRVVSGIGRLAFSKERLTLEVRHSYLSHSINLKPDLDSQIIQDHSPFEIDGCVPLYLVFIWVEQSRIQPVEASFGIALTISRIHARLRFSSEGICTSA